MRKIASVIILLATALVLLTSAVPPPGKLFRSRRLPGQYVDQVTNYFSQHRWAKGKELLDEALEIYPNEANLHYLAGRYWWNGKNYDKARYHLVKACQINYNQQDAKSLLVNVEEITGNYSSAICYVNELLEANPYWKGLWQRKVELYKKMGNFEEANILLKRLYQIYPNDASLGGDYYEVLESTYRQARLSGDMNAAEDALYEMVRMNPNEPEFQLSYANILIQRGKYDEALNNLMAALNANPGEVSLVKKTTDVLLESGRNSAAVNLMQNQMAEHPSPELTALYNRVLEASARINNDSEPYQLFSRVYGMQHTQESLDYLLRESVRRGFDDDALFYIEETRRRNGPSARLVMMEHHIYLRKNMPDVAKRVLEDGIQQFPDDYDINLAVCRNRMTDASDCMRESDYAGAIPLLEFVHKQGVDPEMRNQAVRRLFHCYKYTKRYDDAEQMLQLRRRFDPEYKVIVDWAELLQRQNRSFTALELLQGAYKTEPDPEARKKLGMAYIETAYPYLRERIAEGKFDGVEPVCSQILAIDPDNYIALLYGMRVSSDPMAYVERGLMAYPADITFTTKKALMMADAGDPKSAVELLQPLVGEYPGDEPLTRAFAGVSDAYATQLIKAKDYKRAATVLDFALAINPEDKALLYSRGVVYEKNREWDLAYKYQSHYVPSALEEREFLARMDAIRNKTLHNTVDVGADLLRFGDSYNMVGIGTFGYNHIWKHNTLGIRGNYTGRDAEVVESLKQTNVPVGGRGVQLQLQYGHDFGSSLTASGSVAYGTAYFPRWAADASLTLHTDWDYELGANYRLLQDGGNMLGAFANITHGWSNFFAGGKVTGGVLYDIFYVNASARFRFYPYEGGRSFIEAQLGGGTAPEVEFINYYYTTDVYNQLNTFVALSSSWSLSHNLALQLSGTWNTLYDQRLTVKYRNMFIGHVSFILSF